MEKNHKVPRRYEKSWPLLLSTIVPLAKLGVYAHTGLSIIPSSPHPQPHFLDLEVDVQ